MAIEQLKAGALFDVYSVPGAPDIHRCPFCLSKEIQFSYIHQTSDDVSELVNKYLARDIDTAFTLLYNKVGVDYESG